MTFGTMELIQTVTVPAGGQAAIEFTNIPQTYDDLRIVMSARSTGTNANAQGFCYFAFNGSTSDFSSRRLIQDGTSMTTDNGGRFAAFIPNNSATANTFGTMIFYVTNYKSTNNKAFSVDHGMENNSASAYLQGMTGGLWSNSAAITSISIGSVIDSTGTSTNFIANSTATLYGITRIPSGAKATGGMIYDDATYWYHAFASTGVFTPSQNLTCDVLVVGGGGGSGLAGLGTGGGGAGGLLDFASQALTATPYTITVGGGGAVNANGGDSQFGALTLVRGGGRGADDNNAAGSQGSGGGGNWSGNTGGGSPTAGQGFGGGTGSTQSDVGVGGGGGGKTAAGQNSNSNVKAGDGGAGTSAYSSWGSATSLGQNISGTFWFAGGGGGGVYDVVGSRAAGVGGNGGGGTGGRRLAATASNATAGLANTGGGGGGAGQNGGGSNASAGGSGVVIVRYAK